MSSNIGFYPLVPSWPNRYSKCDLKSCIFGQICSQLFFDFEQICFFSIFHQEKEIQSKKFAMFDSRLVGDLVPLVEIRTTS